MRKLFLAMAMAIVTATVVSAQGYSREIVMAVSPVQTDEDNGNEGSSEFRCGIKFSIGLSGMTKIELESVDGNPLAGKANIKVDAQGNAVMEEIESASTIITFSASVPSGFRPGKDYYISTLPCDLYGGYRLSMYKDGLVADYFGVHQTVKPGTFITPEDLVENELEFKEPDAPLVEKERPKMDAITHKLFIQYRRKPTEVNRQALLERMGIRYDKVVARKKNKLRELEREARTYHLVEHMQGIVNEMKTSMSEYSSNSCASSTRAGTRIPKMHGWCCMAHQQKMPTLVMHLLPMPNMPLSILSLCITKGKMTILLWASRSRMPKPTATGSLQKTPSTIIVCPPKKNGCSPPDTCPRMCP